MVQAREKQGRSEGEAREKHGEAREKPGKARKS